MKQSISELSKISGLDRRIVTAKLSGLPFERGLNNARLYSVPDALKAIFGASDGQRLDGQAEKARLDQARANLAEQELARRARDLIPVAEVAEAWATQVLIAKNRLLALPSRVASDVLRLKSQREIESVIKTAVLEILTELSADPVGA